MSKSWVYHPEEKAKIVWDDEAKELHKQGWFDSPAKFPQKGDKDQGDLSQFTKIQLERYAREVFGHELDRRKSKANLLKEIEALHDSRAAN